MLYTVLIDKSIAHSKVYDRYQFERVGYFSVDPDTVLGKVSATLRYDFVAAVVSVLFVCLYVCFYGVLCTKHTTMLHFIVSRAH